MSKMLESKGVVKQNIIKYKTKAGVRFRTYFETVSPLLVEGTIESNKDEMRVRGSSPIAFCDARFFGDEVRTLRARESTPTHPYIHPIHHHRMTYWNTSTIGLPRITP